MNADSPLVTTFAGLPANYCFTSWNRLALDIVAAMGSYIPGQYSTILNSIAEPDVADRENLWHKLIDDGGDGIPTGRVYTFYAGKWVSPHYFEPGGPQRIWYEGSEASLWQLDEGDGVNPLSTAPTLTTGSFWQRDTNYDWRFPLATGTSAKPTVFNIGDTGGEEDHSLTVTELAPHTHSIVSATAAFDDVIDVVPDGGAGSNGNLNISTESTGGTGTPPVVSPHNNLPPYRVGLWAKRTARKFYVG